MEEPLLVRINGLGHNRILGREVNLGEGVALIYLSDPARPQEIVTEHLQRLYGLTQRETALAALLAKGRSLPGCQEAMGTGLNTLRTQLKSVFAKTGVSSQAALVRLIHAAPVWKLPPPVCRQHLAALAGVPEQGKNGTCEPTGPLTRTPADGSARKRPRTPPGVPLPDRHPGDPADTHHIPSNRRHDSPFHGTTARNPRV